MLRTPVLEQFPGMALMEVRTKLQTPDIVSRAEVHHRIITLCWGCHQTVCPACCLSDCQHCPLLGGKHVDFLRKSWALQLSEMPARIGVRRVDSAPKCPSCHRGVCALCDLQLCPGCLRPPSTSATDPPETETIVDIPAADCSECSRRLCAGCGRCECRRCQPELCGLCLRVRPRRCPASCAGSALTFRSRELPELAAIVAASRDSDAKNVSNAKTEKKKKKNKKKKNLPPDPKPSSPPPKTWMRCPACDRICDADVVRRVFCCLGKWAPNSACGHGVSEAAMAAAAGSKLGRISAGGRERRLEMAVCDSGSDEDESCDDSEQSSEPPEYAELVPPHCRIFGPECREWKQGLQGQSQGQPRQSLRRSPGLSLRQSSRQTPPERSSRQSLRRSLRKS